MELPSDKGKLTWREIKKIAVTCLTTSALATLQGFFNFKDEHQPFISLPTVHDLYFTLGVAGTTAVAEVIRRLNTNSVRDSEKTLEIARKKQTKKLYGPQ